MSHFARSTGMTNWNGLGNTHWAHYQKSWGLLTFRQSSWNETANPQYFGYHTKIYNGFATPRAMLMDEHSQKLASILRQINIYKKPDLRRSIEGMLFAFVPSVLGVICPVNHSISATLQRQFAEAELNRVSAFLCTIYYRWLILVVTTALIPARCCLFRDHIIGGVLPPYRSVFPDRADQKRSTNDRRHSSALAIL